jgi:arsenate reductase
MNKTKVLFLCTGNSARSQMAEALLRHHAGDQFEVYSAGLEPKDIHPNTEKVMQEIGIPLTGHYSKNVREYMGKLHFGYLITVCANAEEKCPTTFPGVGRRLHWAFDDPAAFEGTDEEKLRKFREVRDQIDERIRAWLADQDAATGTHQTEPHAHSGDKQ